MCVKHLWIEKESMKDKGREMAKKENKYKGYDITTQAVHTGTDYDLETGWCTQMSAIWQYIECFMNFSTANSRSKQ